MISIYFRHHTLTPWNVRLAWHGMTMIPRIGDRITGSTFGDWRVVEVCWAGDVETGGFSCVDIAVEDWEQQ